MGTYTCTQSNCKQWVDGCQTCFSYSLPLFSDPRLFAIGILLFCDQHDSLSRHPYKITPRNSATFDHILRQLLFIMFQKTTRNVILWGMGYFLASSSRAVIVLGETHTTLKWMRLFRSQSLAPSYQERITKPASRLKHGWIITSVENSGM